jgi:hypothetical protein
MNTTTAPEAINAAIGATDKADLIARLKAKRPRRAVHEVILDVEVVEAHEAAVEELARAKMFATFAESTPEVAAARAQVDQLSSARAGAVAELHLLGLPRREYETLLLAHPPTEEQKARDEVYNLESFLPELLAATLVTGPTSTERLFTGDGAAAEVSGLIADWNQGEVQELWRAAVAVSTQARNPALPKGFARTLG